MKILFAVNNDNISDAIVKKYQTEYKEILSYKNVYYFNAILRELQKDKSYSRIVISEDLEPFANNNYEAIDNFLFEKYTNISEEIKTTNDKIDVILICADRRKKTDSMLTKIFQLDIYNAIVGQDRSIDEICRLIYSPRDKEEARVYYNIRESEFGDDENSVSEAEVENIRAHYARLGKNEDKYVESFNNIVEQYNDKQLQIIIKYLPMKVKAVLEERSPKYQQLAIASNGIQALDMKKKAAKYKEQLKSKQIDEPIKKQEDGVVEQFIKTKNIKSVVVPTNLQTDNVKKVEIIKPEEHIQKFDDIKPEESIQEVVEQPKKGRGRPRKNPLPEVNEHKEKRGRGRPRKNVVQNIEDIVNENEQEEIKENTVLNQHNQNSSSSNIEEIELFDMDDTNHEEVDLFGTDEELNQNEENEINLFDDESTDKQETENEIDLFDDIKESNDEIDLFGDAEESKDEIDLFNEEEKIAQNDEEDDEIDLFSIREQETYKKDSDVDLFGDFEEEENKNDYNETETNLFGMNEEEKETNIIKESDIEETEYNEDIQKNTEINNSLIANNRNMDNSDFTNLLTSDKKVVAFVGTTKNGTSFVVNNTAELLASMGIDTAILDMTKTRNAYYIYTNNEESLRQKSKQCMENLENGIADGIKVKKNLTVYTEIPDVNREYDIDSILSTLAREHAAILIDTDFSTDLGIFGKAQEIYLVQSMDVLTIQPLTAFLRELKSKNILKPERLRIVINKARRVRTLSNKTLIGGMSCYNAPDMSYMTELFKKDNIKYCQIPFEEQNYDKYLDSLVNCSISLNGYTKQLMTSLKELANMVYPLVNKNSRDRMRMEPFSDRTNNTLNRMRRNY